ncbi:hypothetical protein RND81_03G132300 [Saponaria officinalis]|uniref:Alpha/beta hydrolase fold-3 domain-containing protein n=1 Tax=Saponaria officinalis TaxID=3572 RepID=A0AAW1MAD9_SAPOF
MGRKEYSVHKKTMNLEAMINATGNLNIEDLLYDCRPLFVVYKNGRVDRFVGTDEVPPSVDSITGVESKDVVIDSETGVYVRLYKPRDIEKVGVLVYIHGGAFCVASASSPEYHNYLNNLSFKVNMIVVSINYRNAPEYPLPIGYEDSWAAFKWVFETNHDESWLRDHADLSRVYMAGESAGANIVHNLAKRVKKQGDKTLESRVTYPLKGIVLVNPYFWGTHRIGSEEKKIKPTGFNSLHDKVWMIACPESSGLDDPRLNPEMDHELEDLGVDKILVTVAEFDVLRDRGFYYKDLLLKSGWNGDINVIETFGEDHVFHLFNPDSPKAVELMNQINEFLNS